MRSLVVYAASGCNLRCKHCGVGDDQLRPRTTISTSELVKIIYRANSKGIKTVTLLGGEPTFARSDLASVLEECEPLKLNISINTNLLQYSSIEPLLKFVNLTNLTVSLDGASEATHDAIRGTGTFKRTFDNLQTLMANNRVRAKELGVDLTFVINAINRRDNLAIVDLSNALGIRKLNVETLKYRSFAKANEHKLSLRGRDLLVALTEIFLYWNISGTTALDLYIPPVFSKFLEDRYNLKNVPTNANACGGKDVYGYVDNFGNHLPCPSMSFESNRNSSLTKKSPNLSFIHNQTSDIWSRSTFRGFERARITGALKRKQTPCSSCLYAAECYPCTSDVVEGGGLASVDICQAIKDCGDEFIPGFSNRAFNSIPFRS